MSGICNHNSILKISKKLQKFENSEILSKKLLKRNYIFDVYEAELKNNFITEKKL